MDAHYQPIYRQAAALQHKFHDYTHTTAFDPQANVLRTQIHGLTNDLAAGKNPRVIENRLKTIQTQLRRNQTMHPGSVVMPGQTPIMSNTQNRFLHTNFDRMRMNIRQHPNF